MGPPPFIFDGPLPPELVVGRDGEAAELRAWARAGRVMSLSAPRRYGKTSLIGKIARDAWDEDEMPVVVVDLFGVVSLADLVVRLEQAYRDWTHGWFRTLVERAMHVSQLGLSLSGGGISLSFARDSRLDPVPALHAALDLPRVVAERHDQRVLVVFDEFQALFAVENAEAILRSHAQHQRKWASYLFAGSEPILLEAAFADRARPFYGQAKAFRLGRLGSDVLADAIAAGFASTERRIGAALDPLLGLADGHPQRAMLLAGSVWGATPPGGVGESAEWETALDEARRATVREFEGAWSRLTPNQQRALRAIIRFGSPYRKAAESALALPRSSATEAVGAMLRSGDLERDGRLVRFVDPMLADWVERRFP